MRPTSMPSAHLPLTMNEADAVLCGLQLLTYDAFQDGEPEIARTLHQLGSRVVSMFTPEEWEAYSKMITQATTEGET